MASGQRARLLHSRHTCLRGLAGHAWADAHHTSRMKTSSSWLQRPSLISHPMLYRAPKSSTLPAPTLCPRHLKQSPPLPGRGTRWQAAPPRCSPGAPHKVRSACRTVQAASNRKSACFGQERDPEGLCRRAASSVTTGSNLLPHTGGRFAHSLCCEGGALPTRHNRDQIGPTVTKIERTRPTRARRRGAHMASTGQQAYICHVAVGPVLRNNDVQRARLVVLLPREPQPAPAAGAAPRPGTRRACPRRAAPPCPAGTAARCAAPAHP